MSIIWFSLAQDADFELNAMGTYKYIGNEEYVEIPHIIHGDEVTSINGMFYANRIIKGVKSTNKNIESMISAFACCKTDELNLSEFDFSNVDNMDGAFYSANIGMLVFPNFVFTKQVSVKGIFSGLKTDTLNLLTFDFSKVATGGSQFQIIRIFKKMKVNSIIFPIRGFGKLLNAEEDMFDVYFPLEWIPASSQTEEICWQAVLSDKRQSHYVKIKSKKILMYVGTDYPEYVNFYNRE